MPQGELAHVLRGVFDTTGKRLLVGPQTLDDAGVILLGEEDGLPAGHHLGLVQTVDFFPPVVDDPYLYGAIAAANSASDVYAMGGRPISALSLAGFPKGFSTAWRDEILRGGYEKIRETGAVLAGGHTVESEMLFGYAVTGTVDPARITTNAGAREGDVVYLTKSIGMGTMTTAAKLQKIPWETLEPAARQMATLNDRAAATFRAADVHAATDVTGFGLVGHAHNIAQASELCLRLRLADVPVFPGALELARRGLTSGGAKRGRTSLGPTVDVGADLEDALVNLAFDAETSGGLLIAVAAAQAGALERALGDEGLPVHCVGEFVARAAHAIQLV